MTLMGPASRKIRRFFGKTPTILAIQELELAPSSDPSAYSFLNLEIYSLLIFGNYTTKYSSLHLFLSLFKLRQDEIQWGQLLVDLFNIF